MIHAGMYRWRSDVDESADEQRRGRAREDEGEAEHAGAWRANPIQRRYLHQ